MNASQHTGEETVGMTLQLPGLDGSQVPLGVDVRCVGSTFLGIYFPANWRHAVELCGVDGHTVDAEGWLHCEAQRAFRRAFA